MSENKEDFALHCLVKNEEARKRLGIKAGFFWTTAKKLSVAISRCIAAMDDITSARLCIVTLQRLTLLHGFSSTKIPAITGLPWYGHPRKCWNLVVRNIAGYCDKSTRPLSADTGLRQSPDSTWTSLMITTSVGLMH